MHISMMELPYYEYNIINDPLVLLERIRLLMSSQIRATYPMMALADVMSILFNLRQKDNKYLLDYLERFKEGRNIDKSQLGKNFLDSFIKNTTGYIKLEKYRERDAATEAAFKILWQFFWCEVTIAQYMENLLKTS